jgi:hypothetical protein
MTTVAHPRPGELDALIEEARRRTRLRRIRYGTVALVAIALAAGLYTQLSRGSPLLPCAAGDYGMSVGGQPATQSLIGGVRIAPKGGSCRFDSVVSMSVRDSTGALVPARGNPARWHLAGTLTPEHDLAILWRYGPLCATPTLTFVASVAGGPAAQSSTPAASQRCDAPASKELIRFRQP